MNNIHLQSIGQQIISCQKCDRLRSWCEKVAKEKRKSFAQDEYWGKPVPGFGDENAELLLVGLAPAAHGANRTGRMFTGDQSGKWLYRALHEHGFATHAESIHRDDPLKLKNAYVTSIVHCAPPDNKPMPDETSACVTYFEKELKALSKTKVILALGAYAWEGVFRTLIQQNLINKRPKFGHGMMANVGTYSVIGSYHPSQQNTFTGKLTKPMFDDVFNKIKTLLD